MNGWFLLSAVAAIGIAVMAGYKLIWFRDNFKVTERLGLSLMAGSALMSIPPVLVDAATPFDEWAGAMLRIGTALYLSGKVWRLRRHARRNSEMVGMSREYWAAQNRERGK